MFFNHKITVSGLDPQNILVKKHFEIFTKEITPFLGLSRKTKIKVTFQTNLCFMYPNIKN